MTVSNKPGYTATLWPTKTKIGERIYNKTGTFEVIYGVEYGPGKVKYVSTINIFDRDFQILRTYKLNGDEAEIVAKINRAIPNNLEKATLNNIENEIGLYSLVIQRN